MTWTRDVSTVVYVCFKTDRLFLINTVAIYSLLIIVIKLIVKP